MKIGDLFVALGFEVEGVQVLEKVDARMKDMAGAAAKMTLAVNAVNVALLAMLNTAMKAAVGFRNFTLQTGLSSDDLQRWQYRAGLMGVTANEVTEAFKGLAQSRAQFQLGNPQSIGAWQMLGIDPTQDPDKILDRLHDKFSRVQNVGVARELASSVGIGDGLFAVLRATNGEYEKFNKNLLLTKDQVTSLTSLNVAWQKILFSVTALKNRLMVELVPLFRLIASGIEYVVDRLASFVDWLHQGSAAANIVKIGLMVLVGGLLAVGVALGFITTALSAFAAAMFLADAASWPVVAVVAGLTVAAAYLLATFVPLVLIIQDWWTAFHGGKSFFNWERSIKIVTTLLGLMKDLKKAVTSVFQAGEQDFTDLFKKMPWLTDIGLNDPNNPAALAMQPKIDSFAASMGYRGNVKQENHTTIHIDGAHDPKTTGKEVNRTLKDVHATAARQMPVLSY